METQLPPEVASGRIEEIARRGPESKSSKTIATGRRVHRALILCLAIWVILTIPISDFGFRT